MIGGLPGVLLLTKSLDARAWSGKSTGVDHTRYRDALASGEFRVLLGAYLVEMLGNVIAALAVTVLVFQRSRLSLIHI